MASFRKHDNGWEYRIRFKDPFTHDFKERSKRGFPTKKEAQLSAIEEEKKIKNEHEVDSAPETLQHYLRDWLKVYKKGNVRKNTYELHERNIENHILPYFKNINIHELKPKMYQTFLNNLRDQGYSKRTMEIVHSTLNHALAQAVRPLRKIEINPCEGASIPQPLNPNQNASLKYMQTKDIPLFLRTAYAYNVDYYMFFKTLIHTGMRKGEAAALQRSDVDLKNLKIHITKSLDFQAESDEELFGDTKTFTSARIITIPIFLASELREYLKTQNNHKLNLNEIYRHDLDLVFVRKDGRPLPKSTLFNAFGRILKKTGIPHLDIHSLRHTHAVLLLESGASMKYIQERLGHKRMEITSDIYSHISEKIDRDSLSNYEDYMTRVLQ